MKLFIAGTGVYRLARPPSMPLCERPEPPLTLSPELLVAPSESLRRCTGEPFPNAVSTAQGVSMEARRMRTNGRTSLTP